MTDTLPKEETWQRAERILEDVDIPPYEFDVLRITNNTASIRARLWRLDAETGNWGWGVGGEYLVRADTLDEVIAKKFYVAAMSYAEHEIREAFRYRGRKVFDPHMSLLALWDIADE